MIPCVLKAPTEGLCPMMPLSAAGIRTEPAVSVPMEKSTRPRATATAQPELDPPGTRDGSPAHAGCPTGHRTPAIPVAKRSMVFLPTSMAPAASRRRTTCADCWRGSGLIPGRVCIAVVVHAATSIISLTEKNRPASGPALAPRSSIRFASERSASCVLLCVHSVVSGKLAPSAGHNRPRRSLALGRSASGKVLNCPISSSAGSTFAVGGRLWSGFSSEHMQYPRFCASEAVDVTCPPSSVPARTTWETSRSWRNASRPV